MEQQKAFTAFAPSSHPFKTISSDLKQLFKSPEQWFLELSGRSSVNESLVLIAISFLLSIIASLWTFAYYLSAFKATLLAGSPQLFKAISGSLRESISLIVIVFILQLVVNHVQHQPRFEGVKSGLLLSAYGCLGYSLGSILQAGLEYIPSLQLNVLLWSLKNLVTLAVSTGLCLKFFGNIQVKSLIVLNFVIMSFTALW